MIHPVPNWKATAVPTTSMFIIPKIAPFSRGSERSLTPPIVKTSRIAHETPRSRLAPPATAIGSRSPIARTSAAQQSVFPQQESRIRRGNCPDAAVTFTVSSAPAIIPMPNDVAQKRALTAGMS